MERERERETNLVKILSFKFQQIFFLKKKKFSTNLNSNFFLTKTIKQI